MGQKTFDEENQRHWRDAARRDTAGVRAELLSKSTEELESALVEELRRMDLSGTLPMELSEKLSRFNALERQARTGMRFGMVIGREELPKLRTELHSARRILIDLCLDDLIASRLRSVA